jgi:tripartite-type tricarboxylate transporter receptor subunit TctC
VHLIRRRIVTAAALAPALAAADAFAQADWPVRPVKLIVPGGPGSGTDLVSRSFAELLSAHFKQPFLVENRAGANGLLGTQVAKAAAPDGYTLLFTYAAAQVVNQSLYEKAGFDGATDFEPIAQIGEGGNFLVVPVGFPAKNLQEFIAYVRARPADDLAYGSWGIGSGGHLSMEALIQHAGLKMRHVPYKSTAASNQDLVAGHIQAGFSATAAALPLISGGKLKALAISGPTRSAQQPDVATMTEQGVPFEVAAWYGVFAPKGTPRSIVDRLNAEINRLQAAPEYAQRWTTLGFTLTAMPRRTPDEFRRQVQADIRDWGAVVRKGNIRATD